MLKPKQKEIARYMVMEPDLTNEEYAAYVGINPKTLYDWKKKEEFVEYYDSLCKEKFKSYEALALKKLRDRLKKGDMRAITYVLDGTGYKASDQVDLKADELTLKVSIEE